MTIPIRRAIADWGGRFFALVSLGYIGFLIWKNSDRLGAVNWASMGPAILGCMLLYAFATTLIARGWFELLRALGETTAAWPQAWRIHGRSQLAKYLPGNVFHLAGRHMLGRSLGMRHATLATSAVLEAGLLFLSTLLIALIAAPHWLAHFGARLTAISMVAIPVAAMLVLAGLAVLQRRESITSIKPAHVLHALLLYLAFFSLVGVIASWLLSIQLKIGLATTFAPAIGAYAVAWTLGFVMPGSPGGLGVREAAIVFMLGNLAQTSDLAIFAVLLRIVTIVGDVLLFIASSCAERGSHKNTPSAQNGAP